MVIIGCDYHPGFQQMTSTPVAVPKIPVPGRVRVSPGLLVKKVEIDCTLGDTNHSPIFSGLLQSYYSQHFSTDEQQQFAERFEL